jgi:cytoskeletal protein CcmA (bactofilin family)
MFKKNKSSGEADRPLATETVGITDTVTTSDKTIIGEQISIEGTIRGRGDLVIEGSVKGSIEVEAHHLTIGAKGQVESEIRAANVTISGRLKGNIDAKGKVKLTREADFNGEIKARSISVEDGAHLKAAIELTQEPKKEPASISRLGEKTASETKKETPTAANEISQGK